MPRIEHTGRPGLGYQFKVLSFRTFTVLLAWVLIVAAFYQKPELLTGAQRLMQRGIETVGDTVPSPWGHEWNLLFAKSAV